jgi:hypothetical protein
MITLVRRFSLMKPLGQYDRYNARRLKLAALTLADADRAQFNNELNHG